MEISLLFFCGIVSLFSVVISFYNNSDVFSPSKIYILFNVIFYLDIYFGGYELLTVVTYSIQCVLVLIFAIIDISRNRLTNTCNNGDVLSSKTILIIWLFTFVSIINQIMIINEFGGVLNYIANISLRVEYYRGKGYILFLNSIMATINVIYFSYLLSCKKRSIFQHTLFLVHFFIFVFMALLSGSRSFLLMTILAEIIVYNYISKPLSIRNLLPFFFIILGVAALIGGVRNSLDATDNKITIKNDRVEANATHFKYGLIPLELIYTQNINELVMGTSYLAAITNFAPRTLFPNKFDSGGVAFTKLYTGDRWGGRSNLSTGAVAEGVLNFGLIPGILFGFVSLLFSYYLGIVLYKRMLTLICYKNKYMSVILYVYIILAIGRYPYSEFAYTYYTFILYVLIPVLLIKAVIRLKVF